MLDARFFDFSGIEAQHDPIRDRREHDLVAAFEHACERMLAEGRRDPVEDRRVRTVRARTVKTSAAPVGEHGIRRVAAQDTVDNDVIRVDQGFDSVLAFDLDRALKAQTIAVVLEVRAARPAGFDVDHRFISFLAVLTPSFPASQSGRTTAFTAPVTPETRFATPPRAAELYHA